MLKPKLKEYFDVFPMTADRYQVRGSESLSVMTGKTTEVLGQLLPLLNGRHTVDEIIGKLESVAPAEVIEGALQKLEQSMIVEDAAVKMEEDQFSPEEVLRFQSQMRFFAAVTEWGGEFVYQKALRDGGVSIIGSGELAARIAAECAGTGIGRVVGVNLNGAAPNVSGNGHASGAYHALGLEDLESIEKYVASDAPPVLVLAVDRPEPELVDRVNQISQDLNIPLFFAQLNGTEGIVGPFVMPGKTACLKCYHLRTIRNLDFYVEYCSWEKWIGDEGGSSRAPAGSIGPFTAIVASIAALEIVKRLTGFHEPDLFGKFMTINALTMEFITHPLLRVPRCPSCGKAQRNPVCTPWVDKR
jgi:bacteriocin biosynthesis cyclodehydratase domain-containing protein